MPTDIAGYKLAKDHIEIAGSGGMWDGFKFGRPGLYTYIEENFTTYTADRFTVTEVEGAGTVTQLLVDTANGALKLTSGTNENDGCQLAWGGSGDGETVGESFAPVAGKKMYFETKVQLSDQNQSDFFVGLHVEDTTIIAGRGSDYIGFRKDDGDALVDVECASGSSASDVASVNTMSAATDVTLGFVVTGTEKVEFWVDGAMVQTISSDVPTALMKLHLAYLTGDASSNTMTIDHIYMYQEI